MFDEMKDARCFVTVGETSVEFDIQRAMLNSKVQEQARFNAGSAFIQAYFEELGRLKISKHHPGILMEEQRPDAYILAKSEEDLDNLAGCQGQEIFVIDENRVYEYSGQKPWVSGMWTPKDEDVAQFPSATED